MRKNVNKIASCARFFNMCAFAHNRRSTLPGLTKNISDFESLPQNKRKYSYFTLVFSIHCSVLLSISFQPGIKSFNKGRSFFKEVIRICF